MSEEIQRGNGKLPKGVPLGGSDLFSNFVACFMDPLLSFYGGLGWCKLKRKSWTSEANGINYYDATNGWRDYYLKITWTEYPKTKKPKYPETEKPEYPETEKPKKPEIEIPEKPQYPLEDLILMMFINSYWLTECGAKIGKDIPEMEENYKMYLDAFKKIYKKLPEPDKKTIDRYISKNPFSYYLS